MAVDLERNCCMLQWFSSGWRHCDMFLCAVRSEMRWRQHTSARGCSHYANCNWPINSRSVNYAIFCRLGYELTNQFPVLHFVLNFRFSALEGELTDSLAVARREHTELLWPHPRCLQRLSEIFSNLHSVQSESSGSREKKKSNNSVNLLEPITGIFR